MIRCPRCGSTARVKLTTNPQIIIKTGFLTERFRCGCGCEWEVEYARNKNGYWEVYLVTETKGHIHCPVNGYNCPWWKDGICSLYSEEGNWTDPLECSEFRMFWNEGDYYIDYD
jgi:hypothetical protein